MVDLPREKINQRSLNFKTMSTSTTIKQYTMLITDRKQHSGVDNLNLQVISEKDLLYSETSKAVNGFLKKSDLSK